jgi:hypothetical protein
LRPPLPERGSRGERRNRGDEKTELGRGEKKGREKGGWGEGSWRWGNKICDIIDGGEI